MTTIHYESVGELVNFYLKKKRMTQKDLCKMADIGQATMTNIKSGKTSCSYDVLKKVFEALGAGKVFITIVDKDDEAIKAGLW